MWSCVVKLLCFALSVSKVCCRSGCLSVARMEDAQIRSEVTFAVKKSDRSQSIHSARYTLYYVPCIMQLDAFVSHIPAMLCNIQIHFGGAEMVVSHHAFSGDTKKTAEFPERGVNEPTIKCHIFFPSSVVPCHCYLHLTPVQYWATLLPLARSIPCYTCEIFSGALATSKPRQRPHCAVRRT